MEVFYHRGALVDKMPSLAARVPINADLRGCQPAELPVALVDGG